MLEILSTLNPGEIEDKTTMWMGGTVTSSYETGTVVTTGHR